MSDSIGPYTAVDFEGLLCGYKVDGTVVTLIFDIKEEYGAFLKDTLSWCRKNTELLNTGNRIIISVGEPDNR